MAMKKNYTVYMSYFVAFLGVSEKNTTVGCIKHLVCNTVTHNTYM